MASHAPEQSQTDLCGVVSEVETEEAPNSAVQTMETDAEEVVASSNLEEDDLCQPEGKGSSGTSVFCVVSYPDGHKELTADVSQTSERVKLTGIIGDTCLSDEASFPALSASPISKDFEDKEEEQMNEDIVQPEEAKSTDDNSVGKELSTVENEENELLGLPGEGTSLEQVNFADIDGAVERALLDEEDSTSNCKSNEESNTDLGLTKELEENKLGTDLQPTEDQPRVMEKVYNIDEETRMSLDQTPANDQSLSMDESFTYPSLPPRKLFQLDDTKDSELSETETKLLTNGTDGEDSRMQNSITLDETTNISATSDSNIETPASASSSRKAWRGNREGIAIGQDGGEGGQRVLTAEHLFEYQWPQDGGEWHLLQEQVSEYLNIKSFKRKYPDLERRVCDKEEKDFLREKGVVSETQSDLGLTALRSEEVYDLMMKDHNSKYQEYITFLQEKQRKIIQQKHKEYSEQAKVDKSKMESYSKKAARSAAEFNSSMMKEKKDERRAYFDLQTYTIHWPKNKFGRLRPGMTKVGAYPVAILAGQFQDHYKRYTIDELKYLPVKTVVHDPKKPVKYIRPMPETVRLAILEKQKPPPEPEVEEVTEAQYMDVTTDNSENKENTEVNEVTTNVAAEQPELAPQAVELNEQPTTPALKLEKKVSKLSSKKRPKIELSPERPKKTPKKARESLVSGASEDDLGAAASPRDSEASERGKATDGKGLIPKIHGLEKCRICKQRSTKEERKNEKIVKCAQCGKVGHTSCLDLTEELVAVIKTYPWQCMECKTCVKCLDPFDEDKMMFCDRCDRGYHTFCIGLNALPTGHWECESCQGVPIVIHRPKPPPEETDSLPAKTESQNESSVSAENGAGGTEPTLEAKKELLEGEEVKNSSVSTDPNVQASAAPVVKVERRGRKRKYPIDPNRPVPDPNRLKALQAARAERVTGERQSKRLKQKEEEEEEKKKKEEEEAERIRLKKEKKRRKKLKRLAAEAAAAAAASAALRYGEGMEPGATADGAECADGTGTGVTADVGEGTIGVTSENKEKLAETQQASHDSPSTASAKIVTDAPKDVDDSDVDQTSKITTEENKLVLPSDTNSKEASGELETETKQNDELPQNEAAEKDNNLKLTSEMSSSDSSLMGNRPSTIGNSDEGTSEMSTSSLLEQENQKSVETQDQSKKSQDSASTERSDIISAKEINQEIKEAPDVREDADDISNKDFSEGVGKEVLSKPDDRTESTKDDSDGQNRSKEPFQAPATTSVSNNQDMKSNETVPESEQCSNSNKNVQKISAQEERSTITKVTSQEDEISEGTETPQSENTNPLSDTIQDLAAVKPPSDSSASSSQLSKTETTLALSEVIASSVSISPEDLPTEEIEHHQSQDVLSSDSSSFTSKIETPSSSSPSDIPLQTDTNSSHHSSHSDLPLQTETSNLKPANDSTADIPPNQSSQSESEGNKS